MDHDHADLLPRADAVARVLDQRAVALDRLDVERVGIDDLAGRVLAEPVAASEDQPPHSHATMDGYAVDATEGYPLTVVDREVFPEDDPGDLESGEAVKVATGAAIPEQANAVLKVEEASVEGGEASETPQADGDSAEQGSADHSSGRSPREEAVDGELTGTTLDPGTYVYERGSNVEAGEELFEAGERLSPKDAVLLRDLGVEEVAVREHLSVGLLATGTEIHEGRIDDLDSPMLAGLVESWGHDATYEGTVPDDYDTVEDRVAALADEHDVILTTGGTSVGKKDHVIRVLDELGDLDFHRVAVRPGKPIALADLPDFDATAFAIPGKPVGAHTIASLVARPLFTGRTDLPTISAEFAVDLGLGPSGFEYAVPVTLDDGTATPLGHVDSPLAVYEDTFDPSVLSSSTRATRADGFVLTESALESGEQVRVVPYESVE